MSRVFCELCGDPMEKFAAIPAKKKIPEMTEKVGRKTIKIPAHEVEIWLCMECNVKRRNGVKLRFLV